MLVLFPNGILLFPSEIDIIKLLDCCKSPTSFFEYWLTHPLRQNNITSHTYIEKFSTSFWSLYQATHPSYIRTSIDKEMVTLSVDISIDIAIAIPQSTQTQKVVINTLVYLVYGYYNLLTKKDKGRASLVILVVCCLLVLR